LAIIPARDKPAAQEFAPRLRGWIEQHGRRAITEEAIRDGHSADALIVLGGDGLMMNMAHTFPGVPIIGINFGTVGFLAMVEQSDWEPLLRAILAGDYVLREDPTVAFSLLRQGEPAVSGWAINDVVVRSGTRMIDVELYIDRQYVNTYPGDGMIVASPQGSTAYCMAAGGPILTAGVRGFALTPISPHSPIRAAFVVPEESLIELVVPNRREAFLIVDGGIVGELGPDDIVAVTRGEIRFKMIVVEGMNFYNAFRSKFNYLIRPHAKPSLGTSRRAGQLQGTSQTPADVGASVELQ
jgi:NAD+ kinase